MNSNILFLIVIAILLICFFAGKKAGFIRSLIPIVSALASFVLLAAAVPVVKDDVTGNIAGLHIKDAIISAAAFYITFIILKWLIKKVLAFFRIIGDAPVIGNVNSLLGAISGFIGGLVVIWGAFFFLLIFFGPDELPELFMAIDKNEFIKLLYNNNLIMTLINYFIFAS